MHFYIERFTDDEKPQQSLIPRKIPVTLSEILFLIDLDKVGFKIEDDLL